MASWGEVESEAGELAVRARGFLDAHTHRTLATLRRDGSPRISGTEMQFIDGEAYIGSMWKAVKALDLRRDPRFALHSGSDDPPDWNGDAKIAGAVEEITDRERVLEINGSEVEPSHLFRLEISELVVVGLNEARDKLIIESWGEGRGIKRLER